jgi:putative oxidoreductase
MLGAMFKVHLANGFFMNWYGGQAGEGFEFHLLALALAVAILIKGSAALSVDRKLATAATYHFGLDRPSGVAAQQDRSCRTDLFLLI